MSKRSNSDVFSPEIRDNQRQRLNSSVMENEVSSPAFAILDTSDKSFDMDSLKAKCGNLPDWTENFVVHIANEITKSIKHDVNQIMGSNHAIQNEISSNIKSMVDKSLKELSEQLKGMETELENVKIENKHLKQKLVDQEVYSRRSNLLINGIPEHPNQNLFQVFKSIAQYELNLEREPIIDRIHRKGPPLKSNSQRPRPILVRFAHYQDRMLVWNNRKRRDPQNSDPRHQNRAPKFTITEDFPPEVMEARKRLFPIANEANDVHGMRASVKVDKLILNGKVFDVDSLDSLPKCLIPISRSYRDSDNQIAFFRKYCPLSNHSPAPFKINEKEYNCTEQMFLSEKCYAYGHIRSGDSIMQMTDPGIMVQEAKVCQGFNKQWDEEMYNIMLTANLAKFTQNETHRNFLKSTGDKRLVEGSPYDGTWGVRIAFSDPRIDNKDNWRGENLLGEVLMQTRRLLQPHSPIPRRPRTAAPTSQSTTAATEPQTAAGEDESMDVPSTQMFTPSEEVSDSSQGHS